MTAWPPFRMRIFIISQGVTSSTNSTPTCSSAGRPRGKLSSSTHWMKSSAKTGLSSMMPKSSRIMARSRSLVAGVMRSTMPFGKATFAAIQSAKAGSDRRAVSTTASRVTWPLCGMLSQHMTVKGGMPASRRAFRPATSIPNTVLGAKGLAPSAAIAGWAGSKCPVWALMK